MRRTASGLAVRDRGCQTFLMTRTLATICLTIAVLLGSAGLSASADFQKGLTAYKDKDYATALREWTPLAEQGNAIAQKNIGWIYEKGLGVAVDYTTALQWYKRAGEQGDAKALNNIGRMHGKGMGVTQNFKIAVKYYRLAAEQGDALAQFNLGIMYAQGQGVSKSYETAAKWYRLAAEQGSPFAQHNLGKLYVDGHLGWKIRDDYEYDSSSSDSPNYEMAAKWYKLAAEQGFAPSQQNLAAMYAFGKGVPKNYTTAFMWAYASSMKGNQNGSKLRRFLRLKALSSAEHFNAMKLARECVLKKYKGC